ncbi:sugar-phosphatase [Frankineae bacterium MT45]|nr:sugar-phosphatase [Frankineae bacterium MT45]
MNSVAERAARIVTTDALLLDLDGTLVDTTEAFEASWRGVAAGLDLPWGAFAPHIHGIPAAEVLNRAAPGLSPAEHQRTLEAVLLRQADPDLPVRALPGARGLLQAIPEDRWAIVTSGDLRLATASLSKAGLPRPRILVTIADVARGKPEPDPFLLAAELLGIAADRCVVIEDSAAGVSAGRAAGARVLAVRTTHSVAELADATWIIRDLSEIHAEWVGDRIQLQLPAND